eukprot:Seg7031.1 transcript_id=Seg7031.1/GoldUCD/mRNA.D3Y31 product="Histone acetyltransferase KAT6A" protein_id=Seg7031.1/GoldUCD/D3Y31
MAAKYVPGPEEAEQLILESIAKMTSAKSKKRASSEKICAALSRSHGLDESEVMLQITMMLAENKIENKPKNGLESLKIVENGGQSLEKPRKLSKEEDRLAECQEELQVVADVESKIIDRIENIEKAGNVENIDNVESESESGDSENVESETESVKSISDSEENMVESPDDINKRVLAVEKQVEKNLKQLAEKDVERTGTDSSQNKKIQEMLAKISLLEKENKALHDENVSLRLENLEIKMTKIVSKKDEKKKMVF